MKCSTCAFVKKTILSNYIATILITIITSCCVPQVVEGAAHDRKTESEVLQTPNTSSYYAPVEGVACKKETRRKVDVQRHLIFSLLISDAVKHT